MPWDATIFGDILLDEDDIKWCIFNVMGANLFLLIYNNNFLPDEANNYTTQTNLAVHYTQ